MNTTYKTPLDIHQAVDLQYAIEADVATLPRADRPALAIQDLQRITAFRHCMPMLDPSIDLHDCYAVRVTWQMSANVFESVAFFTLADWQAHKAEREQ